MSKTIVVFSNPFGYGPTGKAISVAEAFLRLGAENVVLAGNDFVHEIVPSHIRYERVDERDVASVSAFLEKIENSYIFSSQNRFAVKAAVALQRPSAFLDGLAWFWDEIPADHLIADTVFWMNYPGIEVKKEAKCAVIVPAVLSQMVKTDRASGKTIIHVGGCRNPLSDIFPRIYLDLLVMALGTLPRTMQANMLVTGGRDAAEYLKSQLRDSDVMTGCITHDQFAKELSEASHLVTTAGQTATLEAFASSVPTSFLPPMNLSQSALTRLLNREGACPQSMDWSEYVTLPAALYGENEKNAMEILASCAESVHLHESVQKRFVENLREILMHIPDHQGQKDFITRMGTSGAEVIAKTLLAKWKLERSSSHSLSTS